MATESEPKIMLLFCPECRKQHVDQIDHATGVDWSTRPHQTHLCAFCDHLWKPVDGRTVGVTSAAFAKVQRLQTAHDVAREHVLKADLRLVEVRESFAVYLLYTRHLMENEGAQELPLDEFLDETAEFVGVDIDTTTRKRVKELAAAAVTDAVGGGGTPDGSKQPGFK